MSVKNQNRPPDPDDSASDDLNSLSAAEKAAFEKIMAEINASAKPSDIEAPPTSDSTSAESDEETLTATADCPFSAQSDDNEQALSDEQQAALDRIMAEINGTDTRADDTDPTPTQTDNDGRRSSQPNTEFQTEPPSPTADEEHPLRLEGESQPEVMHNPRPAPSAELKPRQDITLEEFGEALDIILGVTAAPPAPDAEPVSAEIAEQVQSSHAPPVADPPAETSLRIEENESKAFEATVSKEKAKTNPLPQIAPVKAAREADSPKAPKSRPPVRPPARNVTNLRLKPSHALVLLLETVIAVGGYYGYSRFQNRLQAVNRQNVHPSTSLPVGESAQVSDPPRTHDQSPTPAVATSVPAPKTVPPLDQLMAQIVGTREQILKKTAEIQGLKQYYDTGIADDMAVVEQQIPAGTIPEFNAVITQKPLELVLRSIQRRKIYQTKLDQPLQQLSDMTEELLYHERTVGLYRQLQESLVSLPTANLQHRIDATVQAYQSYIDHLSIDDIQAAAPSIESIWQLISADLRARKERLAQLSPQNMSIGEEICRGDMIRLSLLTRLSDGTARCLARWTGKDMYLIGLTELSPDIARILAQWPGESLSLNGLTTLSAEAARHLAQWPGKRLALNGVTALSAEATRHLSHWNGAQLEMIGLQSIGPWENYITRLYLSENLRKQLEQ